MAILEYASNLSSLLDLVLVVLAVATAGFALKVKFVNEARKAAKEAIIVAKEVDAKVVVEHNRVDNLQQQINSHDSDISTLMERTRHL